MEVAFKDAWRRDDAALEADTRAFWEANRLVPPAERERRVKELCAVAYVNGEAVAVSTAAVKVLPQLRGQFAMYRCSVAPAFRQHRIAERITGFTRERLEAWSLAHPEERLAGLAAVIQASELKGRGLRPLWPEEGMNLNLVGFTAAGEQLRVAWFSHARVEDVAP